MVASARFGLLFLISALTVQACSNCQCLFDDGSHCCSYSDSIIGDLECESACKGTHRADGSTNSDGTIGAACASNGKAVCISAITALTRTPCYAKV